MEPKFGSGHCVRTIEICSARTELCCSIQLARIETGLGVLSEGLTQMNTNEGELEIIA